jgi:hypothetical protein
VPELTSYLPFDVEFSRDETPAFRLNLTNVTDAEVAGWVITAPVRRGRLTEPFAHWDVTVDGTEVTLRLDTDVTATLPDHTSYQVRFELDPDHVCIPVGGQLLLRDSDVCR